VEAKGLTQISDSRLLEQLVAEVLAENPEQLQQYRGGKTKLFGYFVGQLMKKPKDGPILSWPTSCSSGI
jgi:aspartyl-tRNA(Asn)/glutamyl-tRNA(Gln) amidotransferase subunit B